MTVTFIFIKYYLGYYMKEDKLGASMWHIFWETENYVGFL
jgi:hypothetical protein